MTIEQDKMIEKLSTLTRHSARVLVESSDYLEAACECLPARVVVQVYGIINTHSTTDKMSWSVQSDDTCIVFCLGHLQSVKLTMSPSFKAIITLK